MPISQQIGSSSQIKPGVCTSTTRPASPYTGQVIFETDTNRMLVWNSTAWVIPNSPAQNPTGLEYITGGTQSGSTALTQDNVFTSTYLNYRLVMTGIQVSIADRALRINFRTGGSNIENAFYDYAYRGLRPGGASGDTSLSGQTFAEIGVYMGNFANADLGSASIDIMSPQASQRTFGIANAVGYEALAYQMRNGGFVFNTNASFDGFRIYLNSTGNVAFNWQLYGYRKS